MSAYRITAKYDRPVDVLVLYVGAPSPTEGNGLARGVEIDYSLTTGEPIAAKVIGFRRNGWLREVGGLSKLLSGHLSVDPVEVAAVIEGAVH